MSELAIREETIEKEVIDYLDAIGTTTQLLPNEKKMFLNIAKAFQLSPFKREIHITAYGKGEYRKCSIITGYEVYIKRAERTGKLDGWSVRYEGEGNSIKAIVEIYRKDMSHPFVHEVYYIECCQYNKEGKPNAVWAKMPRFMTKKVAISQAFRLCFPDDLGGMPYEAAEVPQEEPRNVTEEAKPKPEETAEEKPAPNEAERRNKITKATGELLRTLNPDQMPFFTEAEFEKEKAIAKGAANIKSLQNQFERVKAELEKRKSKFEPLPFGNETPSMYSEPEADDHFENDYPFPDEEKVTLGNKEELDLH